jgi:excisionase family DNA binding protein
MLSLSNRIGSVQINPAKTGQDGPVMAALLTPHGIADRWLSVDEIASYLGVKRDTVYKWIDRKNLPAHKVGRLWKFRKQEVDEWVCSEHNHPKPPQSHNRDNSQRETARDRRRT